jgi:outer membrane receptor for ferrienterochelin and colicins
MKKSSPQLLSIFIHSLLLFNSLSVEAESSKLESIVVTTTTRENDLKTAPATISVISKEELQLRDADDLTDALSSELGINITSVGFTRRGISIRGMPEKHTLFMLDGQRISSSNSVIAHSDFELSWLPPSAVERIEVVRGPMSSLYGSDGVYQNLTDICQLNTGDVALLKGERWEVNENAGLVHRSPAINEGERRLLLTMDFIN